MQRKNWTKIEPICLSNRQPWASIENGTFAGTKFEAAAPRFVCLFLFYFFLVTQSTKVLQKVLYNIYRTVRPSTHSATAIHFSNYYSWKEHATWTRVNIFNYINWQYMFHQIYTYSKAIWNKQVQAAVAMHQFYPGWYTTTVLIVRPTVAFSASKKLGWMSVWKRAIIFLWWEIGRGRKEGRKEGCCI
jgi:hypothetical protein